MESANQEQLELVIIGSGPAGLSAAIYAARAGLSVRVYGCTPKWAGDYDIDNYYGFIDTIKGKDLQERGLKQAARFGAEATCDQVLGIHMNDDGKTFTVKTELEEVRTCAVLLATGVSRTRPGISNLDAFDGKGVSYCVSCDGFFYRGRPVLVLGEANYAANQALELTQYTDNVAVVSQGKELKMAPEFVQSLADASIPVIEAKIDRLEGDDTGGLERVLFEDGTSRDAHGLFIAMGTASAGDFASTLGLERTGQFISVDYDQNTNLPGVFAAGDCTGGFMQISVAVGEGAKAGNSAIKYVRKNCREAKK